MPIGNLTSQIFANIYLNELDRFVKHELKVKQYLRYGDDFILVHKDLEELKLFREKTVCFLKETLKLDINPKNDKIFKAGHGLKFLGVRIRPDGRILNRRNCKRVKKRLNRRNAGSYYGLIKKHAPSEFNHEFDWWILNAISSSDSS